MQIKLWATVVIIGAKFLLLASREAYLEIIVQGDFFQVRYMFTDHLAMLHLYLGEFIFFFCCSSNVIKLQE